jgi:hypothetical protein
MPVYGSETYLTCFDPPSDVERERITTLRAILSDVKFNDWRLVTGEMGDGHYVQVAFDAYDSDPGDGKFLATEQRCRKWYISRFATRQEVVQTAFKAVLVAIEHETREQFTYRGVAVFGPHIDIDALTEAATRKMYRS